MKTILLLTTILKMSIHSDTMVGGFEKKDDLALCQERLTKLSSDYPVFKSYKITNCETQLVNGINYRMTLVNIDNVVKKCQLVIYESLNKELSPLKYREKENDCFTKFDNQKIDVTTA